METNATKNVPVMTQSEDIHATVHSIEGDYARVTTSRGDQLAVWMKPGLAESIRHRIGDIVQFQGVATWQMGGPPQDWTLLRFDAVEIGPYLGKQANPAECLRRIAKMCPGAWSDEAVAEYQRGRDEEREEG